MLRNRYSKDIGGISIGQKIIHNKPQEGVVLTPSLGIGFYAKPLSCCCEFCQMLCKTWLANSAILPLNFMWNNILH